MKSLEGEAGVSVRRVTVKSISAGSVGDEGGGFQGRVTIVGPARSIDVYFDLFFVRTGRAIVTLTAIGFREPVALDVEQGLIAAMVGRLENTT